MDKIGFVGVGLMGHGMAANILAAGYPLTVIAHRNRAPVKDLVEKGATEAADLATLAQTSDVVHICAPGSPQVEGIVAVLEEHMAEGGVVIDCSTSNPMSSSVLADRLGEKGIGWCDAPLGGTPVQAEAGELAAMVGATPEVFARVEPILKTWAGPIAHVGGPAAGHKMKLLNNFLAMGYGALYAEALALAEKTGLGTDTFDSVIRGSRMDCGFYQTFMGYAVEGNVEAHKFTLTNALKDMTYLAAMAGGVGVANPISGAIRNSYALAVNTGGDGPEDYVPHLVDYVARSNGIERG
ncbi:2-hydroxy-3-oxopropionate reductase [Jannaschia pagri]|uniref:2-hydroxy-3-oxopropionate reductase n=1 Tax=Jannaschia pagri TaxID=2829797 RepID=A0ABQ4NK48_9RHOB|nr:MULTISPECIES: NAD(P)-dependent oxidoreductase [unclassified Jannaschia]GIT90935.1 2-hydroxy-3-oxopropionate reductase [Jannaschia sp. AI_61]GIT94766.1 2-hydroxy-3-oxopropionate reductase [Jannaschia sp. AI_62]